MRMSRDNLLPPEKISTPSKLGHTDTITLRKVCDQKENLFKML